MKDRHLHTLLAGLMAAWVVGTAAAAGEPGGLGDPDRRESVRMEQTQAAGSPAVEGKSTRYPIRGKLKAVDLKARTFTLAGAEKDRTFQTRAQTTFTRQGKATTLDDAVVGEDVGGLVEKQSDGSAVALTVRFGAKPEGASDKPVTRKKSKTPKSGGMSP